MNQEPIIEVKGLQKNFGAFTAVKDVSFTVNKGDVFGFLGPNGAGKSTTMRCMLSLIKPNAGQINIFGKNLFEARNEILAQIGRIDLPYSTFASASQALSTLSSIPGNNKMFIRKGDYSEIIILSDNTDYYCEFGSVFNGQGFTDDSLTVNCNIFGYGKFIGLNPSSKYNPFNILNETP